MRVNRTGQLSMGMIISVQSWRRSLLFGLLFMLPSLESIQAQMRVQQGMLRIVHWPASEAELAQVVGDEVGPWSRIEVLPFLDSLMLGYHYEVTADTVYASFTLAWHPATWGLYRGRRVLWNQMPEDVRLQAMRVRIRFTVAGRSVSEWSLRFDSLALGPWPEVFESATYAFPVEEVFGLIPFDSLQAWVNAGLVPDSLSLDWIAFGVEEDGQLTAWSMVRTQTAPPFIDVVVDAEVIVVRGAGKRGGSIVGRKLRRTGRSVERARTVEGRRSGRSSGRGWFRGNEKDNDDKADKEHETLLPAALAGVAVVAMVAVAGGGLGYTGNLRRTPIGLTGGVLRPDWGVLLQVSMNEAVLERSRTAPEELSVRLLGFSGWLTSRLQPALAIGVRWWEHRGDRAMWPVVVPALVFRADPMVLVGGVDLVGGGPELGVVLNLRHLLGY